MQNRFFLKTVCAVIVLMCLIFNSARAQEFAMPEIECCKTVHNVYEADCTYLQNSIENAIITQEENEDADIITAAIEQSVSTTSNFVYFCFLPLSVIMAPIALVALWITMYYAIYTNDALTVFR